MQATYGGNKAVLFPAQPRGGSVPPILPNISFEDLPAFASQSDVNSIPGSDLTIIV